MLVSQKILHMHQTYDPENTMGSFSVKPVCPTKHLTGVFMEFRTQKHFDM